MEKITKMNKCVACKYWDATDGAVGECGRAYYKDSNMRVAGGDGTEFVKTTSAFGCSEWDITHASIIPIREMSDKLKTDGEISKIFDGIFYGINPESSVLWVVILLKEGDLDGIEYAYEKLQELEETLSLIEMYTDVEFSTDNIDEWMAEA